MMRCTGCGEAVTGRFLKALGGAWHRNCFRCAGCGEPVGGARFAVKEGRPWHVPCLNAREVPPCAVCRGPVRTVSRVTDDWGWTYCHGHHGRLPPCSGCGRLIAEGSTGGGKRYGDGRMVCALCRVTAIDRDEEALSLLAEVRGEMDALGLATGREPIPLRLASRTGLAQRVLRRHGGREAAGVTRTRVTTKGGREVERRLEGVFALFGLSRIHLGSVLAHEMGHVWAFHHKVSGRLSLKEEEGLCVLGEWLWLKEKGGAEAKVRMARIQKEEDPIYGKGFRAALKGLDRLGYRELLTAVAHSGRLPGGGFFSWLA